MRGDYQEGGELFSYVSLEQRIPKRHPIRKMRKLVDEALTNLDAVFNEIYADNGRLSIPPERLIRSSAPGDLLDPQWAAAHGTAGLQSDVPLVCRAER